MGFTPQSSASQLRSEDFRTSFNPVFISFSLCRPGKLQSICSLQARVQDFLSSGENRADNATATVCLPDLKPQPLSLHRPVTQERENKDGDRDGQNKRHGAKGREAQRSAQEKETHVFSSKDGPRDYNQIEARYTEKVEEVNVAIPYSTPYFPHFDTHAPDGQVRMVHTLPDFAQALAEARKARYIRHRGLPLYDRELSIREIFSSNSKDTYTTY